MLTKKERRDYILSHKKELQRMQDEGIEDTNKSIKKTNDVIYDSELYLYKLKMKEHPDKRIKKPKRAKDKLLKYAKLSDSNLRMLYTIPYVNDKEEVVGIDLKPYLIKIRNKTKENVMVLFIKKNKVIKELIYTSNNYSSVNIYKHKREIIDYAKMHKANVYFVHNHPIEIVARPSTLDTRVTIVDINDIKKASIKVLDHGIVTFDDYYSYKQQKEKINKIINDCKNKGISNELTLDLIEYTLIIRNKHILFRKKNLHPNFLNNNKKSQMIKNISIQQYMKIKKQARKEVDRIVKEHPEYAF